MARYLRARYVRHRHFNRIRHSTAFKGFLAEQATRLGMEEEAVFDLMKQGYTADDIRNLSEDPTPVAPANTVAPVASGTPTVGQVLSVTNGTWTGNPDPTYTYQWQRGPTPTDIAGATAATYTLVVADADATVRCMVTATNTAGSASTASNTLGPVAAA